jgi:serine/threonine protein kinase
MRRPLVAIDTRAGSTTETPHVCHVHESPSAADVIARPLVPYFTMEFIDGETVNERLAQRALSLDESLEMRSQLLVGMQAIHRAGVLHLDIKSSNIMLPRLPAGRHPRLRPGPPSFRGREPRAHAHAVFAKQ